MLRDWGWGRGASRQRQRAAQERRCTGGQLGCREAHDLFPCESDEDSLAAAGSAMHRDQSVGLILLRMPQCRCSPARRPTLRAVSRCYRVAGRGTQAARRRDETRQQIVLRALGRRRHSRTLAADTSHASRSCWPTVSSPRLPLSQRQRHAAPATGSDLECIVKAAAFT